MLTRLVIEDAVRRALMEDAPTGDITAATTIPTDETATAVLSARENGVFSGAEVFTAAFHEVDPGIQVTMRIKDGERFTADDMLATHQILAECPRGGLAVCENAVDAGSI